MTSQYAYIYIHTLTVIFIADLRLIILGDQGEVMSGQNEIDRAEIVATKVFYKSIRAPGKRVSPDHFQATLRMLAPD